MNSVKGLLPRSVFIAACLMSCMCPAQSCPTSGNGLFISSSATRLGDLWTVTIRGIPGLIGVLGIDDDTAVTVSPAGTFCLQIANGYTMVPFTLDAMGTATIRRQLPLNTAIDGATRFLQAAVNDPSAPGGMWFSNSLELQFRAPRILVMDEGLNANIFFPMDAARFASFNVLTGASDWTTQLFNNLTYSRLLRRAGLIVTANPNNLIEFFSMETGQPQFNFTVSLGFAALTHQAVPMARRDRATLITRATFLTPQPAISTVRLIDLDAGTVMSTIGIPNGGLVGTSTAIPRSPDLLMAVETAAGFELRRFNPLTGTTVATLPLPAAVSGVSQMTLAGSVIHVQSWAASTQQTLLFRYEIATNSLSFPQGVVQFTGPPPTQQLLARFGSLGAQVVSVFRSPINLLVLSDPVTHSVTTTTPLSSNLPISLNSDGDRIIAFNDQPAGTPDDYTQLRTVNLQSNLVGGPGFLGDVRLSAPLVPRSSRFIRAFWVDSSDQLWSVNTRTLLPVPLATPLPFTLTGGTWRLFSD